MKEVKIMLPNGRKIKVMFCYADYNGEYWFTFKDASYMNFNKGASYGAFVSHDCPNSIDCWELDRKNVFMNRALTRSEKAEFEKSYLANLGK